MLTRIQKSPKLRFHSISNEARTPVMPMAIGFELNRRFVAAGSSVDRRFAHKKAPGAEQCPGRFLLVGRSVTSCYRSFRSTNRYRSTTNRRYWTKIRCRLELPDRLPLLLPRLRPLEPEPEPVAPELPVPVVPVVPAAPEPVVSALLEPVVVLPAWLPAPFRRPRVLLCFPVDVPFALSSVVTSDAVELEPDFDVDDLL